MLVHQLIAHTLVGLGVTQVFGVIGSGNYAVTRSLIRSGARYVAARHEEGATAMADGYARMSGSVPAVTVHQGCGLTNAVTAITEAAKSGTPLLVLAAETAAGALHSNFRIAQDRLVEAVGGHSVRVTARTAARDAELAYRIAVTRRTPVLLNLPLDVQQCEVEPSTDRRTGAIPVPTTSTDSPAPAEAITRLAETFAAAARPVIIAGRGARHAGEALRALGEATGSLLATSAVVRGLFARDRWNLDVSGGFATPLAAELIAEADLVVAFGCALNMWTTRHDRLIGPGTTVVQVDDEPLAPGRHRPVDQAVIGDARIVAEQVRAALTSSPAIGYRTAAIGERIESQGRWDLVPYDDLSTPVADAGLADPGLADAGVDGRIDPRTLTLELNRILDADRVIAVDSGNFLGYPSMFLDVPDVNSLCFAQGFQCVGLGLGTAIGAALAQPDRLPVLGTGDGGILMAASELETVVRLGLAMVIIVYNDGGYGAEVHHFGAGPEDHGFVTFGDTDIARIAAGYGYAAVTVRAVTDLAEVRRWVQGPRDRPLLIDAKVTTSEPSWWLADAFAGH